MVRHKLLQQGSHAALAHDPRQRVHCTRIVIVLEPKSMYNSLPNMMTILSSLLRCPKDMSENVAVLLDSCDARGPLDAPLRLDVFLIREQGPKDRGIRLYSVRHVRVDLPLAEYGGMDRLVRDVVCRRGNCALDRLGEGKHTG